MRFTGAVLAAFFLVLFFFHASTAAEGINIKPVRLFFEDNKTQTVTVTNTTKEPFYFQIETVSWTQEKNGRDLYAKTDEVTVLPMTLTVEPQESKQLRIGLKDATRMEKERTYRIFVRQLPMKKPGENVVKVVVQQGLPVFIPPKEVKEAVSVENLRMSEGGLLIDIANGGAQHFLPSMLEANGLDEAGNVLFTVSIDPWYVLAGVKREFAFDLPDEGCEKLASISLTVKGTGAGEITKSIAADSKACVPPPKKETTKPEPVKQQK